ncbi:MAG: MATE family efflux transporter [Firmicutes bacterium]|nr:MATE family efflux transporter [Bacillota bacterium]
MKTEKATFYKSFFSLYIALVLQNVITLSVNLTDNVMLGAYSETALSGAAAVNQIQFVFQQLLNGLGDGVVIFCSQYWGKKQTETMKRISAVAMHAAITVSVLLFILVSLFPSEAVGIFTTDESIIQEGAKYLQVIRFTYLLFAVTQILLATLRSAEIVKIAFRLSILTFFVNCGLNYLFIFGHFGMPELGIEGAAVGTLAARILEITILIIFIWKRENRLQIRFKDYWKLDKGLCRDYFRVAAPMVVTQGLWGVNTALQTVILGHMTAAAIAANSAASTLFLLVKSISVGASSSASVIIGKTVGGGDLALVKTYAKRLQKLFLGIGILSAGLLFFLRVPFLSLYDLQPETMEMTNTFLLIFCVVVMGMSYQMPTNNGIIRGGGNAMFVVKMDLISIWLIVIPVSFFMAFVVEASPVVVFCCLNADQIFKCIPAFLKANYGNWIRRLTKED